MTTPRIYVGGVVSIKEVKQAFMCEWILIKNMNPKENGLMMNTNEAHDDTSVLEETLPIGI